MDYEKGSIVVLCAVLGAGCVSVGGYERGSVVPIEELRRHEEDPAALAVAKLEAGEPELAFHALEVARTMRFAGEQVARRKQRQWLDVMQIARGMRIVSDGKGCRAQGGTHCVRGGPTLRLEDESGEEDQAAIRKLEERRKVRRAQVRERFWKDYRLIERRLAAYAESESSRSYRSIFFDRFMIPSATNAQLSMARGQAYVAWVFRDKAWALIVTPGGTRAVELEATPAEIDKTVWELRDALLCPTHLDPSSEPECGQRWRTAWRAPAEALHSMVLEPVSGYLDETTSLFVGTDGPLAHIPLGVLRDGAGTMLMERTRVTYVPSMSAYLGSLNRKRPRGQKSAGGVPTMLSVGDPVHVPALQAGTSRLPMALLEAATVGAIFDGSTFLPEAAATEAAVKQAVTRHNVLHFATHGVASSYDPLLSSLLLASAPGGDGYLIADEIRRMDLSHLHVAVLSACQTAMLSDEGGGDDALESLVGSFLVAGAPAVVGSFWSVSDASTTLLMVRFYQAFLEVGVSEALRQAQLSMLDHRRFRHPYFWAAFSAWGVDS